MSIRTRLILGFSVLGLLIPLGVVISLDQCQTSLENAIGNDFALLAQQALDKIDRELSLRLEQVAFHAQHLPQHHQPCDSNTSASEYFTEYCGQLLESAIMTSESQGPLYHSIGILDAQQQIIAYAGSSPSNTTLTRHDDWLSDPNQSTFLVDDSDPNQRLTLWIRLAPMPHLERGFIRIEMNLQGLYSILEEIQLETSYESTQVHLLSRNDDIIYSSHPQTLASLLKRSRLGLIRPKAWKLYPADETLDLPGQLIAQANSRGFQLYNGLGWRLLIAHDTSEVLQPVRAMSTTLLLPATGITLLAWIFALWIASSISNPIRSLERTARNIRDGNLNEHIDFKRNDEIGHLAECLESMTQRLRQTIATMQSEINERRQLDQHLGEVNRDLAITINQLESAHKEVSDFAYAAAHDLKTPIRGMVTLVQWILQDHRDEASGPLLEHMELLHIRAQRCASLVDGILDYCRAGHHRGKIQHINGDVVIRRILDEIQPDISIDIDIQEKMPMIMADAMSFTNVIRPLLRNAIQYCDPTQGEVKITYKDNHDHWTFSVHDNGPGIAPEYHKRIFAIFQTLALRDETEHAGIGLTIAQKTVRAWGGDLWVESQPGQGSTFHFTWPKHPSHAPHEFVASDQF